MYYANCEWYVDMGEHYKPLCERKNLRPAECSECPVYIRSIETENAKLREQVTQLRDDWESERDYASQMEAKEMKAVAENAKLRDAFNETLVRLVAANEVTVSDYMDEDYCEMLRELGVEVDDG